MPTPPDDISPKTHTRILITLAAILLTCWHLVFATLATQILARTTSLLDSRHSLPIDRSLYLRTILPIGILYSGSFAPTSSTCTSPFPSSRSSSRHPPSSSSLSPGSGV